MAEGSKPAAVSAEDMPLINALAKTPMEAEQVYTFAVRLCDNQIDRDHERFDRAGLEKLAELFVGKAGLLDHMWTVRGQTARLYKTEVVDEPEADTGAGEPGCYLKGWAYMVRTEDNAGMIAEIEGGIKKEVSVGCAVSGSVCSICGQKRYDCGHQGGKEYGGRLCYFTLKNPVDAYEWSFVAVPAQREAGVIKRMGGRPAPEWGLDELTAKVADRLRAAEPPLDEAEISRARARLELEKIRYGGM